MSIDGIRSSLNTALRNNSITRDEVRKLFTAANDGGKIEAGEKAELAAILQTHGSKFTVAAKAEFSRLLGSSPQPPPPPPAPTNQPVKVTHEATRKPWTTTYWPMAGYGGNSDGSASSNLWAKEGPLAKFDSLLKARGQGEGARNFELKPALNWLINKESGHYIPNSSLSEKDAERTTGVDFNNNGKIDADVAWDFIDGNGQFGKDGKTDGSMSVGWWGSCDKVARAGILFEEPKHDVVLNGVTFTTQDIKGLLTVLADSQGGASDFIGNRYDANPDVVALKNGQQIRGTFVTELEFATRGQQDWTINSTALPDEVKIRLLDGTEKTFKKSELNYVAREDKRDDPVLMHETISAWLDSGRPAVMDKDSGEHVWNYNFYKADDTLYKDGLKPLWANDEMLKKGFNGPATDGKITWVERTVSLGGGGGTENYRYWMEEKNGKFVNGGWDPNSASPDFLWRPQTEAAFTGKNDRNPFVDPKLVKEIYEASIR
ncbi:MAG: hypothetical protein GQE15_37380 [Archangiaceae bacterium]|nr:hypothetical protein [Archangiaceae bacterium]